MKIILIGDISGTDDEGMKKVGREIFKRLKKMELVDVCFTTVKKLFFYSSNYRNADVIHYLGGPSWRTFIIIIMIKILTYDSRAKILITFIHPHWNTFSKILFGVLQPNGVIVQSAKYENIMSSYQCKVYNKPIVGFDHTKFKPVSKSIKEKIRKELNIPLSSIVGLHVGHINKGRNLLPLSNLHKNGIQIIVIGSTTVKPNKKIRTHLVNSGVLVIDSYVKDIEKYYQASDFYIFPIIDSRACIQVPLSILEAMGCNIPIITTEFEGIPYYFETEGRNLYLIEDQFESSSVMNHINKIIQLNSSLTPDITSFEWGVIADNLLKFYQGLIINEKKG